MSSSHSRCQGWPTRSETRHTGFTPVTFSTVQFVQAGGLKIAYERVGEGHPLVLVHDGRSSDLPAGLTLAAFADGLAALIESLRLGPAHVAGLSWGGTVALELYHRHPGLVATLIMIDSYAGWKGSLPADEVQARVAAGRRMLAAPPGELDPTLPGLFAGDPPAAFVPLLAAIAANGRLATLELAIMAETHLSDLLSDIAVPTLLIWGDSDARSPLTVAHQFQEAIPGTELVVIQGSGHMSNLERPERVNAAVRAFCRTHPPHAS
ncbi:MAG: alpha/beta hydrolase [Candidatus Limnocylindrales bacterium]